MPLNILVTGAGGFVGGSIVAALLDIRKTEPDAFRLFANVRRHEHALKLAKFDLVVSETDLADDEAVTKVVLENEIDIVVHTAGIVDPNVASNLIKALGERQRLAGTQVYYIHTSSVGLFSPEAGWPDRPVSDTDDLLPLERELASKQPAYDADVAIGREAEAAQVPVVNVPLPMVYGKSRGEIKKLSIKIPGMVRSALKLGKVYKFDMDTRQPATHISDLTDLYLLIINGIRHGKLEVDNGKVVYYFPVAHTVPWWKTMDLLAEELASRGLLGPDGDSKAEVWPSYDLAADSLGYPKSLIRFMALARGDLRPVNSKALGWNPSWEEEKFLEGLAGEVDDIIASTESATTAFDALK
ncbi:NAD(P)-binding protein [Sarocladium strictum]